LVFSVLLSYYLYILKALRKDKEEEKQKKVKYAPQVTVVVPTYNDETTIFNKLLNLLEQTYPRNLMEILIVDSASRDGTVDEVKKFISTYFDMAKIGLIVEPERRGKSAAINRALSAVDRQSEIVVITDANAFLQKDALEKLISRFHSPEVGAVLGRQIIQPIRHNKSLASEMIYLKFYQEIRRGESIIDSTPIFDGELSAYRMNIIKNKKIREDLNADDSQLAMIVRREGYKAVMEPYAFFYEPLPVDKSSLGMQKVRRGQGLCRLFWYNKDMLFRSRYGKFGTIIFPANFFMHVMSPFLVITVIMLTLAAATFWIIESWNLIHLIFFLFSVTSAFLLLNYVLKLKFKTKIPVLKIFFTFIRYQFFLLKGIFLFLRGVSLHKWEKVKKSLE